jgi:hypothetical protein
MADDTENTENNEEEEDFGALTGGSDSGMGNLPPLSDFDSADGESDGGGDLPPMDSGDTPSDTGLGGLPPIVDIKVDTPAVRPSDLDTPDPTNASPTPAGFDTPAEELDTPDPADGLGFQDFAADSDFSPETPEIGPGPDSDIETPMFDSAFGGDSDDFSTGGTPTQAMETPMFDSGVGGGGDSGGMGFDNDAFGADTPGGGVDDGTPIPDFSPDTGMPQEIGAVAPGKKAKGGGGSPVKTIVVGLLFLLLGTAAGIVAQPFVIDSLSFLPNPKAQDIADLETKLADVTRQRDRALDTGGETEISQAEIDQMITDYNEAKAQLETTVKQRDEAGEALLQLKEDVQAVETDLEDVNERYVLAAEDLENLAQENDITDARHKGLLAENERLTDMVGELEVANDRRGAVQDTLLHNIDQLAIQIDGGSPLTPARYSHSARLERVEELREKVAKAKWVTPQLLSEYTELYIAELGVSSVREYFFASIPVIDNLGIQSNRWAECLMNGNWSVYYRTLDGDHIGSYENTAGGGVPNYEFREDLPSNIKTDIVAQIFAARVEDFETKIEALRAKEAIYESRSELQRKFSSLAP